MLALAKRLPAWESEDAEMITVPSGSDHVYFVGMADILAAQRDYWQVVADCRNGPALPTVLAKSALRLLGDPVEAADVAGDVVADLATRLPLWLADLRVLEAGPPGDNAGTWDDGLERLREDARGGGARALDPRVKVFFAAEAATTGAPGDGDARPTLLEALSQHARSARNELFGPGAIARLAQFRVRWRCIDVQRRFAVTVVGGDDDAVADRQASPEQQAIGSEALERALERAARLSADQQAALWHYIRADSRSWRLFQDLRPDAARVVESRYPKVEQTVGAIAAEMQRTPAAVSALLSRARRALRESTR